MLGSTYPRSIHDLLNLNGAWILIRNVLSPTHATGSALHPSPPVPPALPLLS